LAAFRGILAVTLAENQIPGLLVMMGVKPDNCARLKKPEAARQI